MLIFPHTIMDYLKIHRFFNTIVGLPIYVKSNQKSFIVFQKISELIVLLGVLAQFMAVPYIWEDMNILCGCLASGTHSAQVLAKTILLKAKKYDQLNYIDLLNHAQQRNDEFEVTYLNKAPEFSTFHHNQSRYVRILLRVQFVMTILSTSSYFLPFLFDAILNYNDLGRQHTPIVVYLHFDFNKVPSFQLVTLFLTICFYMNNLKTVVIDNFFLGIIVLQTSQLKYHKILLEQQLYCIKDEHSLSFDEKKGIKAWIIRHQEIIEVANHFKNLMSSYLLLEFAYVFIHTCVPAFVITSTLSWTLPQKMAVFFIVGGGLLELYLMCRAGDDFTEAYEIVGDSLYRSNLFPPKEKWLRSAFLMVKTRLMRPLRLTAYTIIPLCCTTFVTIFRLIVSYYMTLNEIQKLKHAEG